MKPRVKIQAARDIVLLHAVNEPALRACGTDPQFDRIISDEAEKLRTLRFPYCVGGNFVIQVTRLIVIGENGCAAKKPALRQLEEPTAIVTRMI